VCPSGKLSYVSAAKAHAAVRAIATGRHRRGDKAAVEPYRCSLCPHWHLMGKDPARRRRRR